MKATSIRAGATGTDRLRQAEEGRARATAQRPAPSSSRARIVLPLQHTLGNRAVQRMLHASAEGLTAGADVEAAISRTRGSGATMNPARQAELEQAFGADFSGVRIHTDGDADALSQSLSAVAFTTGRDIYFRQGAYDPEGPAGRRLLAHELTHVVQQSGSAPQGPLTIGPVDDVFEREAEQAAASLAAGPHADTSSNAGAALAQPAAASVQRMGAECEDELMP